ncbi:hypothetical protein M3P36_08165 [Altererythrobacter sp. KTW20L]|uniref:hypothetical protein n=1 Tax=Altererythrobacter sp. KTW20L TaxID=2942210 RepID=UPI0020BFCDA3|nr:hypothetical protein [Altererythrobacter sp. KTW20L]MCL6251014.1 hypothetical protein [Altererythrobacter sp. KTW20L]
MKFVERILLISAGAHFSAGVIGRDDLEWRAVYYGAFVVGAIAAIALMWLQNRRANLDGS